MIVRRRKVLAPVATRDSLIPDTIFSILLIDVLGPSFLPFQMTINNFNLGHESRENDRPVTSARDVVSISLYYRHGVC